MAILDEVPTSYPANIADTLSDDQKAWFCVTCEAQIARWAERLRLLRPVTPDELVKKLDDAIHRQEAMLAQRWNNERPSECFGLCGGTTNKLENRERTDMTTIHYIQVSETVTYGVLLAIEANSEKEARHAAERIAAEDSWADDDPGLSWVCDSTGYETEVIHPDPRADETLAPYLDRYRLDGNTITNLSTGREAAHV
jgi:hypothetical protein